MPFSSTQSLLFLLVSLQLFFLTQMSVPESTLACFYPLCQQFFTGGAANMQAAKTSHDSG